METQIAQDCIDLFVDLLDGIGPTSKISLLLHTNGGQTSAAWRLVNLIRTFCDELEVLIPGIAPCSVELYEAVVAVNDVKRPSQFGQERDCWSPFRSERPARPSGQEVACRL